MMLPGTMPVCAPPAALVAMNTLVPSARTTYHIVYTTAITATTDQQSTTANAVHIDMYTYTSSKCQLVHMVTFIRMNASCKTKHSLTSDLSIHNNNHQSTTTTINPQQQPSIHNNNHQAMSKVVGWHIHGREPIYRHDLTRRYEGSWVSLRMTPPTSYQPQPQPQP
jgi:hypothetical protein